MATTFEIRVVRRVKTGQTNGRAWTLYEVSTDTGRRLTTFDGEWSKHVGERVVVPAPLNGDARLGKFPAPQRTQEMRVSPTAGPDRFTVLDEKLDAVLAELQAIRKHFR